MFEPDQPATQQWKAARIRGRLGVDLRGGGRRSRRGADYTREDFARGGEAYDLIFDAVGKASPAHSRAALSHDGIFLSVTGSAELAAEDLTTLKELIEAGKVKAVIDRRYPLEQIAAAHRYVDGGHKVGNVVITVAQ